MSIHTLTSRGDLAMAADIRPYINTQVTFVRLTKGGLAYVQAHDGEFLSVPLRNLDPKPQVQK